MRTGGERSGLLRRLNALEIAEGALLADIAIVFRLIALFLPVGSGFFSMLNFSIFTLLVLRRGIYVACMSMSVAVFLISIIVGPSAIIGLIIEGMGGIFLGITMKLRWHAIPVVVVGALSGALCIFCLLIASTLLTGLSLHEYQYSLQQAYMALLSFVGLLATRLGLHVVWQQQIYPVINMIANIAFAYWLWAFYVALAVFCCPLVGVVYLVTNMLMRRMGYDVRPVFGTQASILRRRFRRRVLKFYVRRRMRGRDGRMARRYHG